MAETKRTVKLDILTTGFKVAEQDLAKLGRALKEAGNAAKASGGLGGALGGLNKSFMGAGITGDAGLIGLLRGGGAAAAGVFGANLLRDAADAFIDVRDNAKDMAQAFRDAAGSIPILGSIFGAGGAIREAFTGEKAQMKLAEAVGKLVEDRAKDARVIDEQVRALMQREREKLDSVFGERGSSVDAARRAYDDEGRRTDETLHAKIVELEKEMRAIETARLQRENRIRNSGMGLMMSTGFTDVEKDSLASLEQSRVLLQAQREQVRRQLGELGEFAALRAGQREQLESFRSRIQRAGRDRDTSFPALNLSDNRYSTGDEYRRDAEQQRDALGRAAAAMEKLTEEVQQLVRTLDPDRDAGFVTQLQELIDNIDRK